MKASVLVFLYLLFNCTICRAQAIHTKEGDYIILRSPTPSKARTIITGTIKELRTGHPLKASVFLINNVRIETDTLGRFQCEVLPGKYSIRTGFIGYYRIDIAKLKVHKQETIDITFFVKDDDRPIVN
jgi:hypothetical protein